MPEGLNEVINAVSAGTGLDACAEDMGVRNDTNTQALKEPQGVSALQSLPVLAAVSASLQQSPTA
jgi:hypothetical protein